MENGIFALVLSSENKAQVKDLTLCKETTEIGNSILCYYHSKEDMELDQKKLDCPSTRTYYTWSNTGRFYAFKI